LSFEIENSIGYLTKRPDFGEDCPSFDLSSKKGVVDCTPDNSSSFLIYFKLCFDGLNHFTSYLLRNCSLAIRTAHRRRSSSIAALGTGHSFQRSHDYKFDLHQIMALNLVFPISPFLSSIVSVLNSLFVLYY